MGAAARSVTRRRVVVVGGGPAGLAAAAEAGVGRTRGRRRGAQRPDRRADRAGGGGADARRARAFVGSQLPAAARGRERRAAGSRPRRISETVAALAPDAVIVATGARPHQPEFPHGGIEVVQAWDVLPGPPPRDRRVVIADWGGDASRPRCAELLAAAGNDVTLAVGSAALGETLHRTSGTSTRPGSTAPESDRPPLGARRRRPGTASASGTSSRPSWRRCSLPTSSSWR